MISKLVFLRNRLIASHRHRAQMIPAPMIRLCMTAFSSNSSNSSNSNSSNSNNDINNDNDSIQANNQASLQQQQSLSEDELEAILKKNDQYNPERHRMLSEIVKETKLTYKTENHDEYFKTTAMYFRIEEEKALRKLYPGLVRLPKKHPGRLNLEQTDAFFEKYRLDPTLNPPEALADQFKLDVELVKKLLKMYQYPIHRKM